jgi:hypothetical protein
MARTKESITRITTKQIKILPSRRRRIKMRMSVALCAVP